MIEPKVWGKANHIFTDAKFAVSILHTDAGGYCSKHYHVERVNRFVVVSGAIDVVIFEGEKEIHRERLRADEVFDVPAGMVHMFEVVESGVVVEVYWPASPGDRVRLDDIVRLTEGGKR